MPLVVHPHVALHVLQHPLDVALTLRDDFDRHGPRLLSRNVHVKGMYKLALPSNLIVIPLRKWLFQLEPRFQLVLPVTTTTGGRALVTRAAWYGRDSSELADARI